MRILFLGDIVGTPGVDFVRTALPMLRARENIDCVIANAENASAGSGIGPGDLGERDIADVAATVLAFCGMPVPPLDGHAIEEISGPWVPAENGGPAIFAWS